MSDEINQTNVARITITANGPYMVTGNVPLIQRYPMMSTFGEPLAWDPIGAQADKSAVQESYELCRCGHSQNKPYCDGSHEQADFDGSLTADHKPSAARRDTFAGPGLTLTDDSTLCAHAGFCGTRLTDVWKMSERSDDPEVRLRLREMVANCPSGRLQVILAGSLSPEEPEYKPSIAAIPNGPLWVRGGIEVQAPDGSIYEVRNRMTLCRCGQSQNKPFCDGAHENCGFTAPAKE